MMVTNNPVSTWPALNTYLGGVILNGDYELEAYSSFTSSPTASFVTFQRGGRSVNVRAGESMPSLHQPTREVAQKVKPWSTSRTGVRLAEE